MFFSGIETGLTFANRSSSLLRVTLALSMFGRPLFLLGVVVGPLRSTSHSLMAVSTSPGTAFIFSILFSSVSPGISFNTILPEAISSASRTLRTFFAVLRITGPMPSPSISPMVILSAAAKSVKDMLLFIFSTLAI